MGRWNGGRGWMDGETDGRQADKWMGGKEGG